MNRQTRDLIVLVTAVVAASVAAFGVYLAITRIPVRTVEIATRHAVVAAKAMTMGTRVTKESVKLVDWPAKTPLPGGFSDIETVVDRGLLASVIENEPLIESKLAPREAGAGLPPSIPAGMRAMSVKVNEVIGVAGFVVPGTRVDVVVVIRQRDESMSRVVVGNVQVLTAGTKIDQENSKDGKPIPSTVVTLLVSPQDAERIALAQSEGQIMLALRNPLDVAPSETRGVRTSSLMGGATTNVEVKPAVVRSKVVAPVAPVTAPVARIYAVEAIRAAKRTEEPVKVNP
jgi:pilus assembly protein CpaB